MKSLNREHTNDLKVVVSFVRIFCAARHEEAEMAPLELPEELSSLFRKEIRLCAGCAALVSHAVEKRRKCPLDPKPACKHCHIHCYSKDYRAKIREIMAFSGKRLILRGRLDLLRHYFF